jgi:quercetin dioxygenase-like cupin family protein
MNHSEVMTGAGLSLVRSGEGQAVRWGPAGVVRIIAGAESTSGSFSIVETTEPPGSAAPLHVHHAEAEAFYILEGTIELVCGEQTLTAQAGDFVHTPSDVPHKYRVLGEHPARVLLMFSRPGFEQFFAEGGTPLDQQPAGPPDPEQMQRLFAKYELDVLEAFGH